MSTLETEKPSSTDHIIIPGTFRPTPEEPIEPKPAINALSRFSLLGQADALQRHAVNQKPLLGDVCMSGEATIWYAPPNSGKTLIALSLIFDAIDAKLIKPEKVIYLNLDDSSAGLAEKAAIAEDYGFHIITQGHNGFTAECLVPAMLDMIEMGDAKGTLIVIDTLKKFTDPMDKKKVSAFNESVRKFALRGGTFLALAHTNKRPDANGRRIYAGTSDTLDDFDAAYMLGAKSMDDAKHERIVEFECIKKRGGGVDRALYGYSIEDGLDYVNRVSSVRSVDPTEDPRFCEGPPIPSDAEIVGHAEDCLQYRPMAKMEFRDMLAAKARVSKRNALQIIEKYTGDDPVRHKWDFRVGARGRKAYELLTPPEAEPVCSV